MKATIADANSAGYEEVLDRVLYAPSMSYVKPRTTAFVVNLFVARHYGSAPVVWAPSTALAIQTHCIAIMIAVHPIVINLQMVIKEGVSFDQISGGRVAIDAADA